MSSVPTHLAVILRRPKFLSLSALHLKALTFDIISSELQRNPLQIFGQVILDFLNTNYINIFEMTLLLGKEDMYFVVKVEGCILENESPCCVVY